MSNLFILIYRLFRSQKIFFYLFITASVLFIALFASQISMEENISGTIGDPSDTTRFSRVMSQYKFSDKLIIAISLSDTLLPADPGLLGSFAGGFLDSLSNRFDSTSIAAVTGKIPDSAMAFYFGYIYRHLPFFLDENDYEKISGRLHPDSVNKIIRKDYNTLISPAGIAMKDYILRDPLGISFIALDKLRSLQYGGNYIVSNGFLYTRDLKNLLLFITPANPSSETSRNAKLVFGINKLLDQLEEVSGHKIKTACFGSIAVAVENAEQLKADIFLTISVAMVLIILLIGLYFRSIKVPMLGFLPAIFGGGFALAVIYLVKGHISAIALGIGSVILGLIIDYALYFINQFRKRGDAEVVLKEMSLTIFLCFITSAGAFLCLSFLRSTVLNDLGMFAALSVAGAAVFALVFLPQVLTASNSAKWSKTSLRFIDRIASIHFEKKKGLIIFFVLAGIISIFFARQAGFEKDMMALNFTTPRIAEAEKEINRITEVSLKNVFIVSSGTGIDEALNINEKVRNRLGELKSKNVIRDYSGTGGMILPDSLQKAKIRMWDDFWSVEKKNGLKKNILTQAAKLKFTSTAFDPFFGLLETNFEPLGRQDLDYARSVFGTDWITETNGMAMISSIAKVKQEDKEKVYEAFREMPGVVVFDRQMLTNRFVQNVKHDFELLVSLSMIFVTVLLLIAFGRIELALITALPMYLSWLITLGFMGITGIRFNIFNIIISSFIFGLGVDYSIIMMRALQQSYRTGISDLTNFRISVILSSATTLFGVAALFFARHPALNSIALIAVVGVVTVVMTSFVFEPLLAEWFMMSRLRKRTYPVTARIFIKTLVTWGNISLIALFMVITGMLLNLLVIVDRKRRELWFHTIFSKLSKAYIVASFPSKRKLENPHGEDFSKPAIIISNHQSLIETPAFLRLHPKILILTNDWVWNSPVFGPVARFASFFNTEHGIDDLLDRLQEKVDEGYSILVFPEAHRSKDHRIQRFHRGAFYMAEKLNLDILPVVVFGSGDFLPRGAFWGHHNGLYMKILPRVVPGDGTFGTTYSERTKGFRHYYVDLYREFRMKYGTPDYYRLPLILNYVLKGPVLEWYMRVKLMLASNYRVFHELVPASGKILDIGCGYGFISFMLRLTGENRLITGVDHDPEKIETASNGYLANSRTRFVCADINEYPIEPHDCFILSDVLHYLLPEEQDRLIERCTGNLNPGGIIIIRDADSNKTKQHRGTRLTEYFSTRLLGFNKTSDHHGLSFTSAEQIAAMAESRGMSIELIEESKHTSNLMIVIKHKI